MSPRANAPEPRDASAPAPAVMESVAVVEPALTDTPAPAAPRRAKAPDAIAAKAVEEALTALVEVVPFEEVGDHVQVEREEDRVVVHTFECRKPGYRGWSWKVLVARAPRARVATVCDSWLEPGDDAITAPPWVPWSQRLEPGDVSAVDRLAYVYEDDRLMPGYTATGEDDEDSLAMFEFGLGRARVLAPKGYDQASKRWMKGAFGPDAQASKQAEANCDACGFYIPMAGVLRQAFGVCSNAWSEADGRVVAASYGCGAHSETDVAPKQSQSLAEPILDETGFDEVNA